MKKLDEGLIEAMNLVLNGKECPYQEQHEKKPICSATKLQESQTFSCKYLLTHQSHWLPNQGVGINPYHSCSYKKE